MVLSVEFRLLEVYSSLYQSVLASALGRETGRPIAWYVVVRSSLIFPRDAAGTDSTLFFSHSFWRVIVS